MENTNLRKSLVAQIVSRIEAKANVVKDQGKKEEILSELEMFEQIEYSAHKAVEIGSVVKLKTNNTSAQYFLTPALSGEILDCGDRKILAVSIFSTLGCALMGKNQGDTFSVGDKKYEIIEVN